MFIPITSIQDVIEQIGYIGTEEFNPIILIVSGLDVALFFSGPLKPALSIAFKPLKKLAANPAALKVIKILGPFFGNVIQKVSKSRSIDPIINLLPFFMILGEIAADEEARQAIPIIIDAISSSEDLQTWFDYFRLPTEGWEGDEIPQVQLDLAAASEINSLPLSGIMNQAYAVNKKFLKRADGKKAAKKLTKTVKDIKAGDVDDAKAAQAITQTMGSIIKSTGNARIRGILTDTKTLSAGATVSVHAGARYFRNLLRGKDKDGKAVTSRTPIFLQIAAIAYLESKISDSCDDEYCIDQSDDDGQQFVREIRKLYIKAMEAPLTKGYNSAIASGYQYHLTMTALMHLWGYHGSTYGELVTIEQDQKIKIWRRDKGEKYAEELSTKGGTYRRSIDIVTQVEGEDRPRFIELKSFKGQKKTGGKMKEQDIRQRFGLWSMTAKKQKKADTQAEEERTSFSAHKQYMLDRIMSNDNDLIQSPTVRRDAYKAEKIHWLFQSFKQNTVSGFDSQQMGWIRKQMANNVKSGMSWMNASLGQKTYSKTKAVDQANAIQPFNLKTILKGSASDDILDAMFDFEGTQAEQTAQLKKVEELVINLLP